MVATSRLRIVVMGLGILATAIPTMAARTFAADEVPDLAGTWTWSWKDPEGGTHRHVLEVEGIGKKVAAREQFDDLEPVPALDFQVVGKTVKFTIVRGDRPPTTTASWPVATRSTARSR